jgi:hypothetical protein
MAGVSSFRELAEVSVDLRALNALPESYSLRLEELLERDSPGSDKLNNSNIRYYKISLDIWIEPCHNLV